MRLSSSAKLISKLSFLSDIFYIERFKLSSSDSIASLYCKYICGDVDVFDTEFKLTR